jgi:K+ transporter
MMIIGGGALLGVDLLFLAANLTKLVHGAWLPLLIAVVAFTVLTTWQRGRELVTRRREQDEGSLRHSWTSSMQWNRRCCAYRARRYSSTAARPLHRWR